MMTIDDYEVYEQAFAVRQPRKLRPARRQRKAPARAELVELDEVGVDPAEFSPSLNASSEELAWIREHLEAFHRGGLIVDVARRVKGGKEANVYYCPGGLQAGGAAIAAKLYRPRKFRSLKNTQQYQQGRPLLNAKGEAVDPRDWRLQKAVAGKSRKGREVSQISWVTYEFGLMQRLHEAGANVPRPLKHGDYALLMEYVGDEAMAAPMLIDVTVPAEVARQLLEQLLWNVEILLKCGWVHGDLSAYNVLYWQGQPFIIDFPQVISVAGNPDALVMFQRDVARLCQYFARYDIQTDSRAVARGLWRQYAEHLPSRP